jgi:hypothetical protein
LPILGTSMGVAVCTEHWKRSCENSIVVLDGESMPNVRSNAMAFAIYPVERLHEHKSGCNIKDIPLSSVIYNKFEENKCSALTEKMGILRLPSSSQQ